MSRPVRIELSGGLYHITSRGDRRKSIYKDETDYNIFIEILGNVINQHNWRCHAYCLMTNHYHLIIETPEANLSKGMRQLNGVFAQQSNHRHMRVGHLFQGRYKAILVDGDAYLQELARYVVLNPVRAYMVASVEDWKWSSYRETAGLKDKEEWLDTDAILSLFGSKRGVAQTAYKRFVDEGNTEASPLLEVSQQVYLGNDAFVVRMQKETSFSDDINIPKAQRRAPAMPLESIERDSKGRDDAVIKAYATGAYTYQQIGNYFGIHFTTVGRIVRNLRAQNDGGAKC